MATVGLRIVLPGTLVLLFATVIWSSGAMGAEPGMTRARNVLLLIADQHHHAVLGSAGNSVVRTPNLDQLAREGISVTHATAVTPFCSPTRASFVTGQWPHTHRVLSNVQEGVEGITDRQTTLDNTLFDAGYKMRHFGRWGIGERTALRAYRDQIGSRQETAEYRRWLEKRKDAVETRAPRPGEVFLDKLFMTKGMARAHLVWKEDLLRSPQDVSRIGRSPIAARAQQESWLVDRVIDWMEQNADKPFMLTYSAVPPHAPWAAPDPYYSMYDPAKMPLPASFYDRSAIYRDSQPSRMVRLLGEEGVREYLRCYYAGVTMMDELFGRVLGKLRELGLEENTLVIYTSDHGDMQGAHAMMGKYVDAYYDEIVRVPLIVRYPPSIRAGKTLEQHASSVDVMPTILDYLGLPLPPSVQGQSLRDQLDGKVAPDDRPAFGERGIDGINASRMIRTREWKYSIFGSGRRELFHLAEDPNELRNLIEDPSYEAQRKGLEQQLRQWMVANKDPALDGLL